MDLEDSAARLRDGRCGVNKTGFGLGEVDSCTNFAGDLHEEEGMGPSNLFSPILYIFRENSAEFVGLWEGTVQ